MSLADGSREGTTWNGSGCEGRRTVVDVGGTGTAGTAGEAWGGVWTAGATGADLLEFSKNPSNSSLEATEMPEVRSSSFQDRSAKTGCQSTESHTQRSAIMLLWFDFFR